MNIMKRYILIISAVLLSFASCTYIDAESIAIQDASIEAQLNIDIEQSQNTRSTSDIRYVVQAFSDSSYSTPAKVFYGGKSSFVVSTANSVAISINPSEEYHFLMWADDGESYNVGDLKSVSLASGTKYIAEAWHGKCSILRGNMSSYSATLSSAVAKINLVESDQISFNEFKVIYSANKEFNVASGDIQGDDTTFEHIYELNNATGLLNSEPICLFAPAGSSSVVDITIYMDGGKQILSNVPVEANSVTTINAHFESMAISNLVINVTQDWVSDGQEDSSVITIRSLDELMRYIKLEGINAKMVPGTYQITTEFTQQYGGEIDSVSGDVGLFDFNGGGSTYDFEGVRFEITTDILRSLPGTSSRSFYTFHLCGKGSTLKNLEIEFIGDTYTYSGGAAILMDGEDNTIDGFSLTNRGSYPYGYGDLFGKGSNNTINHNKHSGILVRGDRPKLLNTKVYQYSFGHSIFCQGSYDALIEGCYATSELRTTDGVLAEVGTAAANIDFLTCWGYKVPPGYKFSCCEAGIRAYSTGLVHNTGESRNTTNLTVRDCETFQVRSAFNTHFASGTKLVENSRSIDCETAFSVGNGQAINCEGNANIGPVFVMPYSTSSNSTVDIKVISSQNTNIYGCQDLLAYFGGNNHNITFTEDVDTKMYYHDKLNIMFSGGRPGLRHLNSENATDTDDLATNNIIFVNNTYYPIVFATNATNHTVSPWRSALVFLF